MSSVDIKICAVYVLNCAPMDRKVFIIIRSIIMNIGGIYYCLLA